jgi:CTP synthase (UTP-ammonia lyase)
MQILNDFSTSVNKALSEIDPNWESYEGLVICGTHSPHDVEEMIAEITKARVNHTPFLGICFGHQLAAIEYARNVLGIKDATSEEFGKGTYIVRKMPALRVGLHNGESYWNNYEVDEEFKWKKPEHFFTCQYHPEYQSSEGKPHPFLVKFLEYAKENQYKRDYDVAMQTSTIVR